MTQAWTYTELYEAADKLWPGEADVILADPTDDQLALILAVLASPPVEVFGTPKWDVVKTGNNSVNLLEKIQV